MNHVWESSHNVENDSVEGSVLSSANVGMPTVEKVMQPMHSAPQNKYQLDIDHIFQNFHQISYGEMAELVMAPG